MRAYPRSMPTRPHRTSSERRAASCSHARFLRNAIVKEAAAPSSFEARERID
jgi:hypothetical protein